MQRTLIDGFCHWDNEQGLITREMLEQVTRVIKSARRGVIHFDVELGLSLEENLGLSSALAPSIGVMTHELAAEPVLPDAISTGLGYAGVIYRQDYYDQDAEFSPLVPELVFSSPQLTLISHQLCLSDINLVACV